MHTKLPSRERTITIIVENHSTIYIPRPKITAEFMGTATSIDLNKTKLLLDGKDVINNATIDPEGVIIYKPWKLGARSPQRIPLLEDIIFHGKWYNWSFKLEEDKYLPVIISIELGNKSVVYTPYSEIYASFADLESGINITACRLYLDGEDIAENTSYDYYEVGLQAYVYYFRYQPSQPLSEDRHVMRLYMKDMVGHNATVTWSFNVSHEEVPPEGNVTVFNFTFHLKPGWNLISLPLIHNETDPAKLFAEIPGAVLYWWDPKNRSYVPVTCLEPGKGYWLYTPIEVNVTIYGEEVVLKYNTSVPVGWNLIGSVYGSKAIANCTKGLIYPEVFTWTGTQYIKVTRMVPGKGYWLLAYLPSMIEVHPIPPKPPEE